MSKETFRFDVVLRVEIDFDRAFHTEEVDAIASAVSKVFSPDSPAKDTVIAGLRGRLTFVQEPDKLSAWFELPWEKQREMNE